MTPTHRSEDVGARLANAIRSTCQTHGWSQRELATRLDTNQSAIRRLLRGGPLIDVRLATAALELLGIRLTIDADPIGLAARREQRDFVHARCCAYVVGWLRRQGWLVEVEVEIGEGRFRGWIDVLAYRPADGALMVIEVKSDIDDLGRILRGLGWYVRTSREAAGARGWRPRTIVPVLVVLATIESEARLAANRELILGGLPGRADALATWIESPTVRPVGPSLALIDPRSRRRDWLLRTRSDGRRSPAPYRDARAAAQKWRAGAARPELAGNP